MNWTMALLAAAAVCTAACESSSPSGGGVATGGQTATDCTVTGCAGGLICLGGVCQGCTSNGQCDATSICYSGHCTAAAGRKYTITFASGTVPIQNPQGSAWDALGGAPDPYVELKNGGVTVCKTSAKQDTFSAQWNQSCDIDVLASDQFELGVWDEDTASDDAIDASTITDMVPFLHAGGSSGPIYAGSTTSVSWTIKAK